MSQVGNLISLLLTPERIPENSGPRASFGSLMHKVEQGTFLEFLKTFPGLFAALLRLQHVFVCEFWDSLKTGKAQSQACLARIASLGYNFTPHGQCCEQPTPEPARPASLVPALDAGLGALAVAS